MSKWIFLLLLCIPLVSASEDSILTFQNTDNITLSTLCYTTSGDSCTNLDTCNITIYYPNGSLNYSERIMTFLGDGFFESNIGVYNTTGEYKVISRCTSGAYEGIGRLDFRVSQDTKKNILGGFNMLGVILIPLVLAVLMIVGSAILDRTEHKGFKIILFVGSFIPVLLAIYMGMSSTTDTLIKSALGESVWIFTIIFIIILCYVLLYLIYSLFQARKAKKDEEYNH